MEHNWKKPRIAYVLPEGESGKPRKLTTDEIDAHFEHHEDTGWEPKLQSLYGMIGCDLVDCRHLPGMGTVWFDDEGRLTGRKKNVLASFFYDRAYLSQEGILGTAVLVPTDDAPPELVEESINRIWDLFLKHRRSFN
jgi:hypothetical protein